MSSGKPEFGNSSLMRTVRSSSFLQLVLRDVADRSRADLRVVRVEDALEREDHVVGGDRLAVVERHALLEPDGPRVRLGLGLDRLREQHLQLGEVGRADRERLVEVPAAHDVGVDVRPVRVDRVLRAAAGRADPQRAAGPAARRRSRPACPAAAPAAVVVAAAGAEHSAGAEYHRSAERAAQDLPAGNSVVEPLEPRIGHASLPSPPAALSPAGRLIYVGSLLQHARPDS